MIRSLLITTCGLVLLACSDGQSSSDANASQDCDGDCSGSWFVAVSYDSCVALCLGADMPRECAEADCEQFEAYQFRVSGEYDKLIMTHSPNKQQFTSLSSSGASWENPRLAKFLSTVAPRKSLFAL